MLSLSLLFFSSFLSAMCPLINLFKGSLLHCGRRWTPRTRSHKHTSASFRKELRFEMSESNDPQRFEALESNVTEEQGQMSELMKMIRQLTQTRTAGLVNGKRSQAAPEGEPLTTTAATPEGCRPLLIQLIVLQHSELQQSRRSPPTAGWCQNQECLLMTPAGDQCFQLERARRPTSSMVKLEFRILQV